MALPRSLSFEKAEFQTTWKADVTLQARDLERVRHFIHWNKGQRREELSCFWFSRKLYIAKCSVLFNIWDFKTSLELVFGRY